MLWTIEARQRPSRALRRQSEMRRFRRSMFVVVFYMSRGRPAKRGGVLKTCPLIRQIMRENILLDQIRWRLPGAPTHSPRPKVKLYGYFRSSAAFRVRIALNLKGLAAEHAPVHLVRGEQRRPEFLAKNPQGLVPMLELDDGTLLTQSLAIIEYLDALQPEPRLIPTDALLAAKVRAVALAIACNIQTAHLAGVLAQNDSRLQIAGAGPLQDVAVLVQAGLGSL